MSRPLQLQGMVFDMDGILLDTERVSEKCWKAAEKETGFFMPAGFYFTLIGQSMALTEKRLPEVMDPACDIPAFLAVASRHYRRALTEEAIPVKAGARELLEALGSLGIPVCLATSTTRDLTSLKLESTGLAGYLPDRICGDDVAKSKPAPDIYLKAAARLGISPADLLAVEDSENGLKAALAAGLQVAHVPDIGPVPLAVQMRTDRIFRSLLELLEGIRRSELCFPNARGTLPAWP